jgi:uncharacterized protein YkwD
MYRKSVFFFLLVCLSAGLQPVATQAATLIARPTVAKHSISSEFDVFDRINRERAKYRLRELSWDDDAARLARSYSQRMAREGFFDHIDPDGNSVVERAESFRIRSWSMIGENLFMCTAYDEYARLAVSGWMKSPSHRQNILARGWTSTGVGIALGRSGRIYITQVFLER